MPAAPTFMPIAFEALRERLRQEGFRLGVDHQLRLQELLERIGPHAAPGDLKTLLCPIFAANPAQQKAFYEVFGQVFQGFTEAAGAAKKIAAQPDAGSGEPPVQRTWAERLAGRSWVFLLGAALAGALIFMATRPATPVIHETKRDPGPAPPPLQPTIRQTTYDLPPGLPRVHTDPNTHALRWTLPLAPVLLFGAYWLFRRVRRRAAIDRQSNLKSPHFWPIRIEDQGSRIFPAEEVRQLARLMRRREEAPDLVLDVRATILATIRGSGFLHLRYCPIRRPPEYLVFIERRSAADHFAAMTASLMRLLQAEGVLLSYYYFSGDPRRLCAESGDEIWLPDLAGRTAGNRALLFGSLGSLLHPVTGKMENWAPPAFERWPLRAILATDAPRLKRLALFHECGLCVAPASLAGLREVADYFEVGGTGGARAFPTFSALEHPPDDDLSDADELRPWIAACAVYPELNWSLSMRLGQALQAGSRRLDESQASRLARMHWFRSGEIPAPVREQLIEEMPEDLRPVVQESLGALLRSQQPPRGSVAWENWRQALRICQPAPKTWRERLRALWAGQEEPAAVDGPRDFTLLRFLDLRPPGRFSFLMNEKVRAFLFESGLRSLGMRTVAWLPTAVLSAGLIAALAQPWKLDGDFYELQGQVTGGQGLTSLSVTGDGAAESALPLDPSGRFHSHVVASGSRLVLKTPRWPPSRIGVRDGQILIAVSARRATGPLVFHALSEKTPGLLVADFEGDCERVSVIFEKSGPWTAGCPVTSNELFSEDPAGFAFKHDPKMTGEFRVDIDGPGGRVSKTLKVGAPPPPITKMKPPEILSFEGKILDATTAGRTQIQLVWSVRNAVDLWLDRDDGEKPPRLQPEQNTVTITTTRLITRSPIRLTLRADNYDGGKAQKTILVPPSTKPEDSTPADIVSFSAEPSVVEKGKEVALRYAVHGARGLVIRAAGVAQVAELRKAGSPPANVGDSFKVQPAVSTEYELAEEGGATARARVTVTDPPAPPKSVPLPRILEFSWVGGYLKWSVADASDIRMTVPDATATEQIVAATGNLGSISMPGVYTLVAKNSEGVTVRSSVNVIVKPPPKALPPAGYRVTLEKIACYQDGGPLTTAWAFQISGVGKQSAQAQQGPKTHLLLDIPARQYDDRKGETTLNLAFSVPANVDRIEIAGKRTSVLGTSISESAALGNAKVLEVRVHAKNPKDGDFQFVFRVEPVYPASAK